MPLLAIRKNFSIHWINSIVLMAAGVFMLQLSWGKWMDTWIDFGDDLFIQWKILHGAVLYKDIAYFRGPFPLYFNAALFKIFGTGILTLVFFHLLMVVILTVLIYRFFLETSGTIAAFMTSLVFLTMFAFAQYIPMGNFNFVCPYTYAIIDGFFYATLGLYVYLQFIKNEKGSLLFIMGLIAGVLLLTKVELFISYALTIIVGMALWARYLRKTQQLGLGKVCFILLAGALVAFVAFWVYFSQSMGPSQAFRALTLQYVPNTALTHDFFYLFMSGLKYPVVNSLRMLVQAVIYLVAIVLIACLIFISHQAKHNRSFNVLKIIFIMVMAFILWKSLYPSLLTNIFRPLPLVAGAFVILSQWKFIKAKAATVQDVALSIFACFAFFMMVKIVLNVNIGSYGSVLALPAVLLLVVIMVQFLPKMMDNLFNGSENLARCCYLVLIGAVILFCVDQSNIFYTLKNLKITGGRDEIISYAPRATGYGLQFQQALDFVNTQLKATDTFLVLPEGTLLNYLSRKDTGTRYFKIANAEMDMWGEDAMLKDFQQHPPNYILYKIWRTFGTGYFGTKVLAWVSQNYRLVKVCYAEEQPPLFIVKIK